MHRRYWTLVTVLALLSGVALGAQERTVEETVTLEPGGRLSIKNSRGSVQLTSWDQPRVEARARIEAPPDVEEYGQRAIDGTTIWMGGPALPPSGLIFAPGELPAIVPPNGTSQFNVDISGFGGAEVVPGHRRASTRSSPSRATPTGFGTRTWGRRRQPRTWTSCGLRA